MKEKLYYYLNEDNKLSMLKRVNSIDFVDVESGKIIPVYEDNLRQNPNDAYWDKIFEFNDKIELLENSLSELKKIKWDLILKARNVE